MLTRVYSAVNKNFIFNSVGEYLLREVLRKPQNTSLLDPSTVVPRRFSHYNLMKRLTRSNFSGNKRNPYSPCGR